MLTYPQIDPVAISLGPISIHWYGIMYIIAFGGAWVLATYRAARVADPWTAEQISDLIFYGALGAVIGGRMGSVFFYNFGRFVEDPLWLFRVCVLYHSKCTHIENIVFSTGLGVTNSEDPDQMPHV